MATAQLPATTRLFTLHRQLHRGLRPARSLLEVAPWVDVVLLLLLFFIINASFVIQPGVMVDLPQAPLTGGARYGSMVVTISQEGLVLFNDERTTLEGLSAAFAQAARADPGAALVIEADARVNHGTLVHVYNMAHEAGIKDVVLATRIAGYRPPVP